MLLFIVMMSMPIVIFIVFMAEIVAHRAGGYFYSFWSEEWLVALAAKMNSYKGQFCRT
ncbi:hypothetical protein [Endozoicomonas arenosclerae]|uniref:hypothetical protein n=1 Tax=Endozoicomonas arenosclerae TaxID=1633495 RepID=UPI000B1D3288|nr:hypothetical protein [Endozoicomonas arenosclerae]